MEIGRRAFVLLSSLAATTCVVALAFADFDPLAWARRPSGPSEPYHPDVGSRPEPVFPPDPPFVPPEEPGTRLRAAIAGLDRFGFFGLADADERIAAVARELDAYIEGPRIAAEELDARSAEDRLSTAHAFAAAVARTRFGVPLLAVRLADRATPIRLVGVLATVLGDRVEVLREERTRAGLTPTAPPTSDERVATTALLDAFRRAEFLGFDRGAKSLGVDSDAVAYAVTLAAIQSGSVDDTSLTTKLNKLYALSDRIRVLECVQRAPRCSDATISWLRVAWKFDRDREVRVVSALALARHDPYFPREAVSVVLDETVGGALRIDALDALRAPAGLTGVRLDEWVAAFERLVAWARTNPSLTDDDGRWQARAVLRPTVSGRLKAIELVDLFAKVAGERAAAVAGMRAQLFADEGR